jgi:hypothetical protein
MKKQQKPTEKHYFARVCRVLGRFCMCIGAIFAVGGIILAFLRLTDPSFTDSFTSTVQHSAVEITTQEARATSINTPSQFDLVLFAIAITAAIIALFWRALKSYNNALRELIAKCAKLIHAPIFGVEIIGTLAFWMLATIFITSELPLLGLYTLAILIINELLFVFAWASYGRPAYTL